MVNDLDPHLGSRQLRNAVDRWALGHDAALISGFDRHNSWWDYALRIAGHRVTVKILTDGSEARVRVTSPSFEATAKTSRGLLQVLSRVERRLKCT